MKAADRIRGLIEARGITTRELSRRIGVSHVTIGKWTKGEFVPSGENLEKIANFFSVTPAFILFGEPGIDGRQTVEVGEDEISIPVLDVVASCGQEGHISPAVRLVRMFRSTREWLLSHLIASANLATLHILTADGDSMEPSIHGGDFVFVDTSQTRVTADAVYAIQYAGSIFIKRVMTRVDGSVLLISDNKRYEPQEVRDPGSLNIVGRVVLIFNVKEP